MSDSNIEGYPSNDWGKNVAKQRWSRCAQALDLLNWKFLSAVRLTSPRSAFAHLACSRIVTPVLLPLVAIGAMAQTASVSQINRENPAAPFTQGSVYEFEVLFSDDVKNVDITDFELSGPLASNAQIDSVVFKSANRYIVYAHSSVVTASAELGLDVKGVDASGSNDILTLNDQLDQQSLADVQIADSPVFGQSFTAGATGQLWTITIKKGIGHSYAGPGVMEIRSGSGFSGTVLASQNVNITSPLGEQTFQFEQPATVSSGSTYTMRFHFPGGSSSNMAPSAQVGANYSGGILYYPNPLPQADLYFKTYIETTPGLPLSTNLPSVDQTFVHVICDMTGDALDDDPVGCEGVGGSAFVSVSGGNLPLVSYLWSNGEDSSHIDGLTVGDYSVTVTDTFGCTLIDTVSVPFQCDLHVKGNGEFIYLNDSTPDVSNHTYFGALSSGDTVTRTYMLTNFGTGTLNLGAVSISGSGASAFTVFNAPVTSLNPGFSTTLSIQFTASSLGTYDATVSIPNSSVEANPFTFDISSDVVHNGFNFDGNNDRLRVSDDNALDVDTAFTIEAWIKPDVLSTSGLVTKFGNGSANRSFSLLLLSSGALEFSISQNGASETYVVSSNTVQAGVWTHVAAVYDGSQMRTYINGVQDPNTQSASFSVFNSSKPLLIGARENGPVDLHYDGSMDEVRLWNVARTATELNDTKNCQLFGGESGLVAYYDFNQGIPAGNNSGITSIPDGTSNNLDAQILNANLTNLPSSNFVVGAVDSVSSTCYSPVMLNAVVSAHVSCNGLSDGSAKAIPTAGLAPFTYLWSNGTTTDSLVSVAAGAYTVTVSDAFGSSAVDSMVITEPAVLASTTVVDSNVTCNGFSDGGATASGTGGTQAYNYMWSNSAITASITGIQSGTYSVTITDANGCTDSSSVMITEPAALVAASVVDSNVSCHAFSDAGATASATGGTGAYTYAWNTGATLASIGGMVAGVYSVTITDVNGCTDSSSVMITEPAALVAASVVDSNASCNGFFDGGATASATGGSAGYTYLWSNSASTASITGVAAGTYSVTITDANACTDSASVTITEPVALMASSVVDSNASCNGFFDGGATASATGGTGAYTYMWSNTAITASITGVTAGIYSVTITDASGCTSSTSTIITEPTALSAASVIDSNASCHGFANGGATASASGGTGAYSYSWSNGATTASITAIVAGTYSVTITDANGCTDSTSVTISEPTPLAAASVVDSNLSCNSFSNGGATASASGGTGAYTYNWINSASTASITGVVAGTYSVTITDANGCTDSSSVTISEPAVLIAAAVIDSNASCNSFSDGGATASAFGGTAAYAYTWSNSATTASITGVTAGTYSVTVTDINGCTDSASVIITEPTAVVAATVIDSNVTCHGFFNGGGTASAVGGTGSYSFLWNNTAATASITGVSAGSYAVTITDATGCTDSSSLTISEPTALVASSVVDSNVSCNSLSDGGTTASATGGTGAYTYSWSNAAITSSISGVAAGSYSVTITDANGCTDSTSVTITEPTALIAASVVDSNVSCNSFSDGGATASAAGGTGAYTYLWSNAATSASITGVATGTYSVTITDANGCTDSSSITITEPTALVAASVLDSNVTCNGFSNGGATASAIGGTAAYTYTWSNSATTASITGVTAGTYSVTVTDANGCTDSSSVTITEPTALVAASVVDSNATCNGFFNGGATASATGGTGAFTYLWNNSATTASITGVSAGTYAVTITDASGCTDSSSVTITEPSALVAATMIDSNVSCNGLLDGGATASATGGTGAYTYLWSNSAMNASITGEGAGTYAVTITDANGCTDVSSETITEPTALVATSTIDSNASCNGFLDGGATSSAIGGTGAYTYSWSNSAITASITGVGAGTYSVTITDANGCTDVSSETITEPAVLVATSVVDSNVSCNAFVDGGATSSANGGSGNYSYLWSNAAPTASITGIGAGVYSVTITDANGCTDSASIAITEPTALVANSIVDSNVSCNTFSDGGATSSATGGTSGYSYLWSNSAITASITGLAAGSYAVTITDANGCTDSSAIDIAEPDELMASIATTNVNCRGGSDGSLEASASGGTMNYSYLWSTGDATAIVSDLLAGSYGLTVTDANGCVDTLSASIDVDHELPIINLGDSIVTSENQVNVTAPSGLDSYLWSNGLTSDSITIDSSGSYWVMITDSNGCMNSDTVYVSLWPTGISEWKKPLQVSIYPNPSDAIFTVETSGDEGKPLSWSVFDLNGSMIQQGRLMIGSQNQIDLGQHASGLYMLRLTSGDSEHFVRIVLQ